MKFLATEKIAALLDRLAEAGNDVRAPQLVRDSVNTVLFLPWQTGGDLSLDMHTSVSAKELLLPATERLFSFSYARDSEGAEQIAIEPAGLGETGAQRQTVLFGARVCDARAIGALDALFGPENSSDYNDPAYQARRARLTVITLACTTADAACFCSSFGEGTADSSGSDLILYPVDGGFVAEAVSESGNELIAFDIFEDSDRKKPALAETARIDATDFAQKFAAAFSDIDFWQRAAEKCNSCGYCTFACPACHCFDIFDEMSSDREGERCRSWDACMFYNYTLETSGHNPRPTPAHRYRNRVGHKFSYFQQRQGQFLCTGCGRCIRGCPAGMDIRDVVKAVAQYGAESGAAAGDEQAAGEAQQ